MRFQKAALIYNPVSGRRKNERVQRVELAAEGLRQQAAEVTIYPTEFRGHATQLAAQAVDDGCDLIAVSGGDGTINEALGPVSQSAAALLPLPSGTANVLAEEVGLPIQPDKAVEALPTLLPFRLPLGTFETLDGTKRNFLLMCGVGVDAEIIYHLNTQLKSYLGKGAYWLGSLEQLSRSFKAFRVRLTSREGDVVEREATFALLSKSRMYAGTLVITANAHLLDPEFEVVLFEGHTSLRYVGYMAEIATQTLGRFPGVSIDRAVSVEIEPVDEGPIYAEVDGELAGQIPARVTIGQSWLNLLIPPAYERAHRARRRAAPKKSVVALPTA